MTSWRDTASVQAQEDLDRLLNVALGFARQQLATHGEFFPYAAAIDAEGQAEMVAAGPHPDNEHPRSTAVIESCIAALASQRDHIRASAMVSDVNLIDGSDAIRVELEHAEGQALTILLPYAKKQLSSRIDYGQIRAQPGQPQIWS
jgi:hypothetical protein